MTDPVEPHDALLRASALDRARAEEASRARELLAQFLADARAAGLMPSPLVARGYDGRGGYRTGVEGWYLKKDRSVAVGTDGEFYVLSVQGGLVARLRGATLSPSDPPLELGRGGRDGESIPLSVALSRVLERSDR
ncbi:hypothetical protein RN607_10485 [Demequina capsici]|uniref:Uncharacterized protein n=1 Tax=Demequina capsici TaxID=3075620 RepID=A0AA96JFA9_9MICO|nr:hypothetical protein [Demequina sp. PMTSA13]WNM26624.1 hypothetical protein RN607_10485 [Demequina sp. PMTSA13]